MPCLRNVSEKAPNQIHTEKGSTHSVTVHGPTATPAKGDEKHQVHATVNECQLVLPQIRKNIPCSQCCISKGREQKNARSFSGVSTGNGILQYLINVGRFTSGLAHLRLHSCALPYFGITKIQPENYPALIRMGQPLQNNSAAALRDV